jgi:hypothetical protein
MGACQSQVVDRAINEPVSSIDKNDQVVVDEKQSYRPSITLTPTSSDNNFKPSKSNKSFLFRGKRNTHSKNAYAIALVSPSERTTDATEAMTPFSAAMSPNVVVDHGVGIQMDEDEISDLDVPSDEELDEQEDIDGPSDEEGSIEGVLEEWNSPQTPLSKSLAVHNLEEKFATPQMVTPQPYKPFVGISSTSADKKKRFTFSLTKKKHTSNETLELEEENEKSETTFETPEPIIPTPKSALVPLLAPPKTENITFESVGCSTSQSASVNPQAVANFNKLKVQAQQAEKLEKQRRQQEKVKDRRHDIEGYKSLFDEFSSIQDTVTKKNETMDATTSQAEVGKSFINTTTWLMDISALNALDQSCSSNSDEDDDERSQGDLSLLSEASFRVQKALFKEKARQRRRALIASGSIDGASSANGEGDKRSVAMNDNESTVSDFSSDNESVPDKNDDYGVLQRFRNKSIESSVMNYSSYYADECYHLDSVETRSIEDDAQSHNDVIRHEAFLEAPTPKTGNNGTSSINAYLEEMALPSVSIENAETGVVRWRTFPKNKERAKTARKLEFHDNERRQEEFDAVSSQTEEGNGILRDVDVESKMDESGQPKIKTYHPVISTLSKEEFFRVSKWCGGIPRGCHDLPIESQQTKTRQQTQEVVEEDCDPVSTVSTVSTNTRSEHSSVYSSFVVDGGEPSNQMKDDLRERRDLLARKVGSRIHELTLTLQEKGVCR